MAKLTNLSSIGRLIGQRAGFDQQLWLTERRVELIRELACYEGGLGVVRELEHGTLSELGAGKHLSGVLDVLAEPEVLANPTFPKKGAEEEVDSPKSERELQNRRRLCRSHRLEDRSIVFKGMDSNIIKKIQLTTCR
ncbi:hypothetical protein pipiens_008086 [Culex pipiens pipiens]|uniref:Uncharacterized protein n=1 Tax=Culex pipiens pipiens TaxID=38569 RepID=A0ABD1CBW4_CULPP